MKKKEVTKKIIFDETDHSWSSYRSTHVAQTLVSLNKDLKEFAEKEWNVER